MGMRVHSRQIVKVWDVRCGATEPYENTGIRTPWSGTLQLDGVLPQLIISLLEGCQNPDHFGSCHAVSYGANGLVSAK